MRRKILFVEDDEFSVSFYGNELKNAGFELVTASDGMDALAKIKSEKPDLILLDLILPHKNGFEVLEELKGKKSMPIVILSNLSQDSDIEKAKALGAVDYFIKSDLLPSALVEKLKVYIS